MPTQKNSASWDLQLGFNLAFKRLKQKDVTQTGIKLGLGVFRKIICFEGLSQHITVALCLSRLIGMKAI